MPLPLPLDRGIFGRLRRDTGALWDGYVRHRFVLGIGDGSLPAPAFQHFLRQDYLFLIQFARAYALAGYKSTSLADLREAASSMSAIVDVEMPLHIAYCARWGVSEAQMEAEPEALETIAYTRFVLETGLAGDRLDLEAALAPCVVGYGEAVERLLAGVPLVAGNPYATWMEAYASDDYRAVASAAIDRLDRLWLARGSEARYPALLAAFSAATRLETAFWEMGWVAA
jgi:thiaminase/transcriptional activator TenA